MLALVGQANAAPLASPVAVPYASGPAFPQGRQNGNSPDPEYAAERAIDGDRVTFCCLLDDTLEGDSGTTIPANAKAPVTGHMVFDLGKRFVVFGAEVTSRAGGVVNPKNVDYFHFTDGDPTNNAVVDDVEGDADIAPLLAGHSYGPLGNHASATVTWNGVVARFIGLRVNSSYESGNVHHNFQIGEIRFLVGPAPPGVAVGTRVPPIYSKKPTLQETMLATRTQYASWFGVETDNDPSNSASLGVADKLWDQLRTDFPRASHRLHDFVLADWFGDAGWFGSGDDTGLEEAAVRRAAEEAGRASGPLLEKLHALRQSRVPPDDRRWLDLCVKAADVHSIMVETQRLQMAVDDLADSFPRRCDGRRFRQRLGQIEAQVLGGESVATLTDELRALQREALVTRNSLLSPGKLVFVKRYTYTPGYYYANFMTGATRFGGNLCVLSLPDGGVTELVPELAGGIFDRFDLSFDGKRVVFGYRREKGTGFRLYEVGVDGSGLRQLTVDPSDEAARVAKYWHPRYKPSGLYKHHTDDFHPCYLPDGGICFASTRCERSVLCAQDDSLAVNTLYRADADGSNLHILSEGALSELVTYIQEFQGPQPRAQKTNVKPLPPKALGSHASKLIAKLREGHNGVELSQPEFVRLVTWADANAPYYGSYFGRRNLKYRDHPDFRPVPTLASASGVAPAGQ